MDQFINVTQQLFIGFCVNCFIFAITLLLALPLGLIISMGSMAKFKPLKWLTKTFVWIIRGTPLMLQLFVVFYVPPLMSNGAFAFQRMTAAWRNCSIRCWIATTEGIMTRKNCSIMKTAASEAWWKTRSYWWDRQRFLKKWRSRFRTVQK